MVKYTYFGNLETVVFSSRMSSSDFCRTDGGCFGATNRDCSGNFPEIGVPVAMRDVEDGREDKVMVRLVKWTIS